MFRKFHDDTYDGIVIKIPRWILEVSDNQFLLKYIETFNEILQKDFIGKNHLDIEKSIYEITNYKKKKEEIENKKKIIKLKQEIYDEIYKLFLDKKLFLLCEYDFFQAISDTVVELKFKDSIYRVTELITRKGNASIKLKELNNLLLKATKEEIFNFIKPYGVSSVRLEAIKQGFFKFKKLYVNSYGLLAFKITEFVICNFTEKFTYFFRFLETDKEGNLFYKMKDKKVFIDDLLETALPTHWFIDKNGKIYKLKSVDISDLEQKYKQQYLNYKKEV